MSPLGKQWNRMVNHGSKGCPHPGPLPEREGAIPGQLERPRLETKGPLSPRRSSIQAGFTLLEIMVVVVLIAISATFLVVNLDRGSDDVAELEARRFAQLVEHARDESILSGRPFAVQVDPVTRSYVFLQYGGQWTEVKHDDVFRRRVLPGDLAMAFETASDPGSGGLLIIEGLGVITPFVLTVRGDTRTYKVSVDAAQNIVVTRETDATG